MGASSVGKQNIYSSGCSNNRITLECPDYHKIAIKRLFYGVKNDTRCAGKGREHSPDCCQPTHNDCLVVDDLKYPSLNMLCSGHRGCDIEAESIRSGTSCRANGYGEATDYMSVIHDCIPDEDISTFCSDTYKRGRLLYLSNKNYPGPISKGKESCQCLIRTGNEVGLDIHALDIIITRSHVRNQCYQDLQIKDEDGYQKEITCGHAGLYGFRNIYNRDVRTVTLTLNSRAIKKQGYVWLQAKASNNNDYVEIYCGNEMKKFLRLPIDEQETRTTKPQTEEGTAVTGGAANGTANASQEPAHIVSDMVALIAGVAVAMAMVIIIGLIGIIILCVRRSQEKRQQQQAQRSFPSPSLKSKEDHTSNSYCKYDYDEDKYCSIKRSPMRMTKFGTFDADQKLKEAFLQGVSPMEPANQNTYVNYQQQNSTNQNAPLLDKKDELDSDKSELIIPKSEFIKVGQSQPKAIREITMSTLPEKRKGKNNKTVTFSPIAMVTPLPSGSEESVPEDYLLDEIKASIIDGYSKTLPVKNSPRLMHDPENLKHGIVMPRSMDDSCLKQRSVDESGISTFQSPGCENVTEEDLWKAFHIKLCDMDLPTPPPPEPSEISSVTMDTEDPDYDENPYDNIPYMNTGSLRRHNAPEMVKEQSDKQDIHKDNHKIDMYMENPNDIYRRICNLKPIAETMAEPV